MANTWIPFAIRRPGPSWKVGYPGVAATALSEKEGELKHSAEGPLAATLAMLDGGQTSSWTGTIAKDGRLFQHYPLEYITWHAGLPGDRRTDTSLIGNLTLFGWEHEGGGPNAPGEPLTELQYQTTLRVSQFIREKCLLVALRPPTLRGNLWEHRELSATSCPSGRIPWTRLIQDLQEDDMGMTPEETAAFNALKDAHAALKTRVADLEAQPYCVRTASDPTVYFVAGGLLISVRSGAMWDRMKSLGYCGETAKVLPDTDPVWKSPRVEF